MTIKQVDLVANLPFRIAQEVPDMFCDILIQNPSVNVVYVKDNDTVALMGLEIDAVTGHYTDSASDENLWLIAGANSTVYVRVNYYPKIYLKRTM